MLSILQNMNSTQLLLNKTENPTSHTTDLSQGLTSIQNFNDITLKPTSTFKNSSCNVNTNITINSTNIDFDMLKNKEKEKKSQDLFNKNQQLLFSTERRTSRSCFTQGLNSSIIQLVFIFFIHS